MSKREGGREEGLGMGRKREGGREGEHVRTLAVGWSLLSTGGADGVEEEGRNFTPRFECFDITMEGGGRGGEGGKEGMEALGEGGTEGDEEFCRCWVGCGGLEDEEGTVMNGGVILASREEGKEGEAASDCVLQNLEFVLP